MSVHAMSWAWQHDLPMGPKAALVALANYADGDGVAFPGQARLCAMVGCSERAMRRYLDDLEGRGLIARQERRRADGSRTSDEYRLAWQQPANVAGSRGGTTGQSSRSNRPTWPTLPANLAGHEPSEEPSEEPSPSTPPATPALTPTEAALQVAVEDQAQVDRIRRHSTHDRAVLASQHPDVWRHLAAISSARSWKAEQLQTVSVRVLQLVRDHTPDRVVAALEDVRANLAEVRYPMRYVEVSLTRQTATDTAQASITSLVDELL